jgi:RHS repeat-associated protein
MKGSISSHGQLVREESISNGLRRVVTTREYVYDDQARIAEVTTTIEEYVSNTLVADNSYQERTTYDAIGRVFQQFDASSEFEQASPYLDPVSGGYRGGRGQRFEYNLAGYLKAIHEAQYSGSQVRPYWTVRQMDARGNVTDGELGNGMRVMSDYDPATGELLHRVEERPGSHNYSVAQMTALHWDPLGRLYKRSNYALAAEQHEWFDYDARNRLIRTWYSDDGYGSPHQSGASSWTLSQELEYNLAGNIEFKSGVGTYVYHPDRPHAVSNAGNRSFDYDANGNLLSDGVRTFSYHAFNKLHRVESEGSASEFYYGPSRARVLRRDLDGTHEGAQERARTHYVGNVEIHTDHATGRTEYRRNVAGRVLVTYSEGAGTRARYQHRDHLGSIVAMSDESGHLIGRMSFDPWGQRRDPHFAQPAPNWVQWTQPRPDWLAAHGDLPQYTPRGFTGHEHVDDHGLIHMNGRIYDPHLGRFLQADPFIEDTGTLNRYTYVHNSPLNYTDPSGYFSVRRFLRTAAAVFVSVYTGGAAAGHWGLFGASVSSANAVATVAIGGALSSAIASGGWESAKWGAFSGMMFYNIGQWISNADWAAGNFAGSGLSGAGFAAKSVSHGLAGGVISHLQGGRFGHGFASSGVTAAVSPYIAGGFRGNRFAQGAFAAMVGGSTSRMTGGKFANGAVTAAMAYAFNQAQGERQGHASKGLVNELTSEERAILRGLFPVLCGLSGSDRLPAGPDSSPVSCTTASFTARSSAFSPPGKFPMWKSTCPVPV